MPQAKRRKFSLDEHDGKEGERNRANQAANDGAVKKQGINEAGAREGSGSQRTSKRSETVSQPPAPSAAGDDGKEGGTTQSSTGDAPGRVSSSGRVIKQTNKGRCFTAAREAALNKQSTSSGHGATASCSTSHTQAQPKAPVPKSSTPVRRKRGKKRRSWDLWSKFEQDSFFEGLLEHGKDFDAIHNLLAFRSKKRGINSALIKTKEQVRHLYYRMWQKISKHVNIGNNVKKETQEIYGLVNYYAIRKIFKRLDERSVEHLNELIHAGFSKVRDPNIAGKKNRKKLRVLRTPVCNALKKLNNIEDSKEEFVTQFPQQVTVEMTPRSSSAWLKVHNLSQNPRVRFQVSVNRSISSLMEHLCKKWRGPDGRLRQSLGGEGQELEEMMIYPHHSYTLQPVTLAPQRATSVDLITFSSYQSNVLNSPADGNKLGKKSATEDPKPFSENSSDADGHGPVEGSRNTKNVRISLLPKLSDAVSHVSSRLPCEDENAMFPDAPFFSSPAREAEEKEDGGEETPAGDDAKGGNAEQRSAVTSIETSPPAKERHRDCRDDERDEDMRRVIDTATKGFTRDTSKQVTLAQLSLMLGKKEHIRLEYDWRMKLLPLATSTTPSFGPGIMGDVERLTNMLRRLSNMANLEYRDIMQRGKVTAGSRMSQCTLCGHTLDRSNTRRKTTSDASTETDPIITEMSAEASMLHPARQNSNGTLVGMTSRSTFINTTKDLTPDTDGVFRVPMPINLPMSIRGGGPQRMSTQPTVGQLIRPPELRAPKPNFMIPRKRKPPKKPPVLGQRTLLPKVASSSVILVPHTAVQQNLLQTVTGQPLSVSAQPLSVDTQQLAVHTQPLPPNLPDGLLVERVHPGRNREKVVEVQNAGVAVSSLCSMQQIAAATPSISAVNILGENSSEMFSVNLDMPIIISSPEKSSQQFLPSGAASPSLSSILDISLPAPSNQGSDAGDKFLEMVNGGSGFSDILKDDGTKDVKDEENRLDTPAFALNTPKHSLSTPSHIFSSPPQSPHQSPLKSSSDIPWLNETQDISLSGFLSSPVKKSESGEGVTPSDLQGQDLSLSRFLVSPVKKTEPVDSGSGVPLLSVPCSSSTGAGSSTSFIPNPPSLFGESSQDSLVARLDMDTAIQNVMMESSIDYSTNFEKLAKHLADNSDS